MLLSYDSDMLSMFKIILNTIPIINYNKITKNVNVLKKFHNAILSFYRTYVKITYNSNTSPDSSVGRAVD